MKHRIKIEHETGQPVIVRAGNYNDDSAIIDIGSMIYIDDNHIGLKSFLDLAIRHYPIEDTKSEFLSGKKLIKELQKFPAYS